MQSSKILKLSLLLLLFGLIAPLASQAYNSYSYDYEYGSSGPSRGLIFLLIVVCLAIYLFFSYCLQRLAKKTNTPNSWMAYVPVFNLYLVTQLAQKPKWWLLLLFIPFINFIFWILAWVGVVKRFDKPVWWGPLMVISPINAVLIAIMAFGQASPGGAPQTTSKPSPTEKTKTPTEERSESKPDILCAVLHFIAAALIILPFLSKLLISGGRYFGYFGAWFSLAPYIVGGALIYLGYDGLQKNKSSWKSVVVIDSAAILYCLSLFFYGFRAFGNLLPIAALIFCLVRAISRRKREIQPKASIFKTPAPKKEIDLPVQAGKGMAEAKGKFCTQCGSKVKPGDKFCGECGARI